MKSRQNSTLTQSCRLMFKSVWRNPMSLWRKDSVRKSALLGDNQASTPRDVYNTPFFKWSWEYEQKPTNLTQGRGRGNNRNKGFWKTQVTPTFYSIPPSIIHSEPLLWTKKGHLLIYSWSRKIWTALRAEAWEVHDGENGSIPKDLSRKREHRAQGLRGEAWLIRRQREGEFPKDWG